jgi:predicted alpha/beta hydrolase family esterase
MPKVFIIHGAYGNPNENWIPWLKEELEKIGCEVFVPRFPTPENQSLETWLKVFGPFQKQVDENSILIGHSIGANFVLHILEKSDRKIRAAFIVAGAISPVVDPKNQVNEINKTFYKKKFNWKRIRENCKDIYTIISDNDPYITMALAEEISKPLGVTLTLIEGGGHFNRKAGYEKFPQLLEMVEDVLTAD